MSTISNNLIYKAAVIVTLLVASVVTTQMQSLALLLTALSLTVYWTISVLLFSQSVRVVLSLHPQS
jgi:hypothetical protein